MHCFVNTTKTTLTQNFFKFIFIFHRFRCVFLDQTCFRDRWFLFLRFRLGCDCLRFLYLKLLLFSRRPIILALVTRRLRCYTVSH
jgi:hypothetical protein